MARSARRVLQPDLARVILQAMVFVLGFCTAGLLALACLPAVWRRAIRLTTRRLTQLVPLSMDEIVAERDGLRAAFAVDQRRLEQKIESIEAKRSEVMVRLGHRDAAVAALEDAAAAAAIRIAGLSEELQATTRELHAVRAETGTAAVALHDLTGLAERRHEDLRQAEDRIRSLDSIIDQNRGAIAALELRVLGLDDGMADLDRALGGARAELARTVQAVGRATAERDRLAAEVERLGSVAEASRDRAAAEAQAASASRSAIDDMTVRLANFEAHVAMQAEAAQGAQGRMAALEAEKASMARRLAEVASPPPAPGPSAPGGDAELAVLRETLRQVADDVLRFTERRKEPEERMATVSDGGLTAELSLPP